MVWAISLLLGLVVAMTCFGFLLIGSYDYFLGFLVCLICVLRLICLYLFCALFLVFCCFVVGLLLWFIDCFAVVWICGLVLWFGFVGWCNATQFLGLVLCWCCFGLLLCVS